jgi:hypothetical protein
MSTVVVACCCLSVDCCCWGSLAARGTVEQLRQCQDFIITISCCLTYVHHMVWKPERCLRVFMSRPEEIGSTGHRPGRPDSQDLFVGLG